MIGIADDRQFLMRPDPKGTESIRSLLNRLMQQNKLSPILLGKPEGIGQATDIALALAQTAGWNRNILLERGALVATRNFSEGTISVGISRLGKRSFVGNRRRICPQCMTSRSDTPLAWEIFINQACHIHRCLLVDRCSSCQEPLGWLSHDLECNSCGHPWSQMQTQHAPSWACTLSRWIQASIARSIRGVSEDGRDTNGHLRVRLDKLLLMMDVLRHVLMRAWLSTRVWDQFNLCWTVDLLKSPDYRFWLWHSLFLHAAKEPMTLGKALVPTGNGLTAASFYGGLAKNVPIPAFILESLRQHNEGRLVSKLSSLEIFDPRLHGIRPSMQIMSGYRNNDVKVSRRRANVWEFHEEVREEQETGFLMSPC
jgi:hypothetical protein